MKREHFIFGFLLLSFICIGIVQCAVEQGKQQQQQEQEQGRKQEHLPQPEKHIVKREALNGVLSYIDRLPEITGQNLNLPEEAVEMMKLNEAAMFFYELAVHNYWIETLRNARSTRKPPTAAELAKVPKLPNTHSGFDHVFDNHLKASMGAPKESLDLQKLHDSMEKKGSRGVPFGLMDPGNPFADQSWLYQNVQMPATAVWNDTIDNTDPMWCAGKGLGTAWKTILAGDVNLPAIWGVIVYQQPLSEGPPDTWWLVWKYGFNPRESDHMPQDYWLMGMIASASDYVFSIRNLPGGNLPNKCGSTIGTYFVLGAPDCSRTMARVIDDKCGIRAWGLSATSSLYADGLQGSKVTG